MPPIVSILYILVLLVFIVMGAAIVFHMLRYKINRRTAMAMFLVYIAGAVLLLTSNISLFFSVDWYRIIANFGF